MSRARMAQCGPVPPDCDCADLHHSSWRSSHVRHDSFGSKGSGLEVRILLALAAA